MTVQEMEDKIQELRIEIANHNREWFGMIGTTWEKEDKRRKFRELRKYEALLYDSKGGLFYGSYN